jgi:hypothetical protein
VNHSDEGKFPLLLLYPVRWVQDWCAKTSCSLIITPALISDGSAIRSGYQKLRMGFLECYSHPKHHMDRQLFNLNFTGWHAVAAWHYV